MDAGSLFKLGLFISALIVGVWIVLMVLASRLPDGLLKDLARFIPDCLTTARRLRADPRVPLRAKLAVGIAVIWLVSPLDLIPEFLPIIGPLDDIVVVGLALRYAARAVPRRVLIDAWPGRAEVLARLLGENPLDEEPAGP